MGNLVIARRRLSAQLKTVERRFAGHRCAVLAPRCQLARQNGHDRIVAQFVMVVDVLVTQRKPEHPLSDQGRNAMLDQFLAPIVDEARGKAINQPDRTIRRTQQKRSGIRRDHSTIKTRHNIAPCDGCKLEQFCVTLRRHRGAPRINAKSFSQNNFR